MACVPRAEDQERGVPLYWVIEPDGQFAEIRRPEDDFPTIERRTLVWHPSQSTAPFRLELAELFRAI